jgi:hypothetical protein
MGSLRIDRAQYITWAANKKAPRKRGAFDLLYLLKREQESHQAIQILFA